MMDDGHLTRDAVDQFLQDLQVALAASGFEGPEFKITRPLERADPVWFAFSSVLRAVLRCKCGTLVPPVGAANKYKNGEQIRTSTGTEQSTHNILHSPSIAEESADMSASPKVSWGSRPKLALYQPRDESKIVVAIHGSLKFDGKMASSVEKRRTYWWPEKFDTAGPQTAEFLRAEYCQRANDCILEYATRFGPCDSLEVPKGGPKFPLCEDLHDSSSQQTTSPNVEEKKARPKRYQAENPGDATGTAAVTQKASTTQKTKKRRRSDNGKDISTSKLVLKRTGAAARAQPLGPIAQASIPATSADSNQDATNQDHDGSLDNVSPDQYDEDMKKKMAQFDEAAGGR